jgi:MFS family permease
VTAAAGASGRLLVAVLSRLPTYGPLRGLRHPAFFVFWSSYLITQLGFWMSSTSLQWLTSRLTNRDPQMLGLLYFFNLIPLLILSPWAGVAADRYERTKVVALSQAMLGLLCLGLVAYLSLSGREVRLELVYVFAFAAGTLLAVSAPSAQAVVANAVPPADLPSAIGLQAIGLNVARVAGPGMATPMLVTWGSRPVLAAYAEKRMVPARAGRRIRLRTVPGLDTGERAWRRIVQGLEHVHRRPPSMLALCMVATTSVFGSAYVSQLPTFAYDVLNGGDLTFALLVVATGLGAVTGALATSWRDTSPGIAGIAVQMILMAVGVAVLARSTVHLVALALALVIAALNFSIMTSLNMTLQYVVAEESRGRVMSLYILAWGGLIPVGSLVLGTLASQWGIFPAVTLFSATQAAIASVVLLRQLRQRPARPELTAS